METYTVIFCLVFCKLGICCYGLTLSSLPTSLLVSASPSHGQAGKDSLYKFINVKLCYAPESQKDRGWRKTIDNLAKDKTCQYNIVDEKPYSPANNTFTWTVSENVPSATYFVRAYPYDSADVEVAFGQTTNAMKTDNLFEIEGISGCHTSIDIAAVCFSAFFVLSLFGFFYMEMRKSKATQQK